MSVASPTLFAAEQTERTSDDYYTPKWLFDRMALRFDLDVAAPPEGVPWLPADRFYSMADDGLSQEWRGRVWMNPPYSNVTPWWRRFVAHRNGIALLPAVKSQWLTEAWDVADALVLGAQGGEMHFVRPGIEKPGRAWSPVLLVAFGDKCVEAIGRVGTLR